MTMRWYVLHSKPHRENLLWNQLSLRDIEAYYPCIHLKSIHSHILKVKPYFPGYLFVHIDRNIISLPTLQWMPGAIGLVCYGGEPADIPEGLLHAIRERVDQINNKGEEGSQKLKIAQEVTIRTGPFAGYRGILASYLSDQERVIVLLGYLRDQQVRVQLPVEQIS